MSDSDGIEETLETVVRVAVMAAAQVGERRAREREAAERAAEARSAEEARELGRRLEAERAAARAVLAPTANDPWWDTATPEQVGAAYEQATAWAQTDPEAATVKVAMDEQLRRRYNMDPAGGVNAAGIERAREAARERGTANSERAEAAAVMAAADRLQAESERPRDLSPENGAGAPRSKGETLYDSIERREQFAQDMLAAGVEPDDVESRILADVSQGAPATEATSSGRAPSKARRARGRAGSSRQRAERAR